MPTFIGMNEPLYVVISRGQGAIKEVNAFDSQELAELFADRVSDRPDRDRVSIFTTYKNLPFTCDQVYEDE